MNALDRELAALVRGEADNVAPPPGAKERGWTRLQAAVARGDGGPDDGDPGDGGGTGPAPAPQTGPSIAKVTPWLKIAPVVALLVSAALVGWDVGRSPPAVADQLPVAAEPEASRRPPITIPFTRSPVAPAPPVAREPAPPAEVPVAAVKRPTMPRPPAGAEDDFAGELGLLAAGQAAIVRGDLREGLALLKQHRQRYPRGHFAQERDALLAIARCEAGQAGALAAGRKFLRAQPDSVHADRVRTACKL